MPFLAKLLCENENPFFFNVNKRNVVRYVCTLHNMYSGVTSQFAKMQLPGHWPQEAEIEGVCGPVGYGFAS